MKSRLKAFSIHLACSLILIGSFYFVFVRDWYPDDALWLQGGIFVMLIILMVDVVLGPVITLIIFQPRKKSTIHLAIDMFVVIAIQLCAFAYAVSVIKSERPQWLTYVYDRFYLISSGELIGDANPETQKLLPKFGSLVVAQAKLPWQVELSGKGGEPGADGRTPSLGLVPGMYIAFPADMKAVIERSIKNTDAQKLAEIGKCSDTTPTFTVPVIGKKESGVAVLDSAGKVLCIMRDGHN